MRRTITISNTVKVSKRHQVVIPVIGRRRLNIRSGDRLIVDIQGGMLILLPQPKRQRVGWVDDPSSLIPHDTIDP